ncbi:MAG: hypothetical protein ABIG44_16535 [Planctomycetota bacterium]
MPESGPIKCPECGNDLNANPTAGTCSDCGFPFDEQTRIWKSARTWHHHAIFYGILGLFTGVLVALAYRLAQGEVPNALLPVALALGVATLGLLMQRALSGRLSSRYVALTPAGIQVGVRAHPLLIPWEDVRRLSTRKQVPQIKRHSTSFAVALEDIFDNPAELDAFATALQQARQQYRDRTTQ